MRKDCLENSTLTEHINGKMNIEKQRLTYLTIFGKSLKEKGVETILENF